MIDNGEKIKHDSFFQKVLQRSEINVSNDIDDELCNFPPHSTRESVIEPSLRIYPSSVKTFVPKIRLRKTDFSQFIDCDLDVSELRIFQLCSALWDPVDLESLGCSNLSAANQQLTADCFIKHRISEWLITVLNSEVEIDTLKNQGIEKIYHMLTGRRIAKAVLEAIKMKDFRLATILSQIGGPGSAVTVNDGKTNHIINGLPASGGSDSSLMIDLFKQAENWRKLKKEGLNAVDEGYLSVYSLLSGDDTSWDKSVLQNHFSWLRTFSMYFWYSDGGAKNLADTLSCYAENFTDYANHLKAPFAYDNSKHYDTNYQLLKLFAGSGNTLEMAINPLGHHSRVLDTRVSWFLGEMLANVKNIRSFINFNTSQRLIVDLIYQLECLDLLKWAIFVAGFLSSQNARELIIRELLTRNYPLDNSSGSWKPIGIRKEHDLILLYEKINIQDNDSDNLYSFLTETLNVPKTWIHEARALRAEYCGNIEQQVISLIDCHHFTAAHCLLFMKVIPINLVSGSKENIQLIKEFLLQFPADSCGTSWDDMGGLVLKFIQVLESPDGADNIIMLRKEIMGRLREGLEDKWIRHCRLVGGIHNEAIMQIRVCISYMVGKILDMIASDCNNQFVI